MKSFAIVLLALTLSAGLVRAQDFADFHLQKAADSCDKSDAASSTADYGNCLGAAAASLAGKMTRDLVCFKETCVIRLSCEQDGKLCKTKGFSVTRTDNDTGSDFEIKLPSGTVAHYGACGSCTSIEADDDDQIPVQMLFMEGKILMEIRIKETVAK